MAPVYLIKGSFSGFFFSGDGDPSSAIDRVLLVCLALLRFGGFSVSAAIFSSFYIGIGNYYIIFNRYDFSYLFWGI